MGRIVVGSGNRMTDVAEICPAKLFSIAVVAVPVNPANLTLTAPLLC